MKPRLRVVDEPVVENSQDLQDSRDPQTSRDPQGSGDPIDLDLEGDDLETKLDLMGSPIANETGAPFEFVDISDAEGAIAPEPTLASPAKREADTRGDSALTAYLNQLRRHPLMTRAEEHEVAVEYVRTRDPALAARLVTANLRLVVKLARDYGGAQHHLLDLIQEGNLGLVRAVQKYDPTRGVKLSSYAAWWIRAYILKFTLSNCRLVRIGTTQVQRRLFFSLGQEREKLEKSGCRVDAKHLAASLDVSEEQVIEMERRLGAETRLDAPIRGDGQNKGLVGDFVSAAEDQRPDAQMESGEFRAILRDKLQTFEGTLAHRDLEIFQRRLLNDEPVTAVQIAHQFGISRERVRQLEERLRQKLRRVLEDELGDAVGSGFEQGAVTGYRRAADAHSDRSKKEETS